MDVVDRADDRGRQRRHLRRRHGGQQLPRSPQPCRILRRPLPPPLLVPAPEGESPLRTVVGHVSCSFWDKVWIFGFCAWLLSIEKNALILEQKDSTW